MSAEYEGRRILGGTNIDDFLDLFESEVTGFIDRDGVQTVATWSLELTTIHADTARLGEQCPDLSLEAQAHFRLQTNVGELTGDAPLLFDSWTVEGWVAELYAPGSNIAGFEGPLTYRVGGDDFEHRAFSMGEFSGTSEDGATTMIQFANN